LMIIGKNNSHKFIRDVGRDLATTSTFNPIDRIAITMQLKVLFILV